MQLPKPFVIWDIRQLSVENTLAVCSTGLSATYTAITFTGESSLTSAIV